jgi:uncharacterized membrane protein YdjX (TVP38/TMEM64 family)
LVVLAAVGFFSSGASRWLSWESLKEHRDEWQAVASERPVPALVTYATAYVVVTALSVPGATVMTLAGGALFGRWLGLLIVSFASTLGATLAFLATRFLFRDFVQKRWGARLEPINRGVDAEGPYYLFALRLVPAFPFFLINAAMGLTRMRVRTFWWVSQVGMLPGTFLYVNAGAELGRVSSPRDVLSPRVLAALALLAAAPLAARWALRWWEGRRARRSGHPGDARIDEQRVDR